MREITEDYSEYCTCCGERWSDYVLKTFDSIHEVRDIEKIMFRKGAIVYFLDGTKENMDYKEG
ncbi:MAG: hypothetical protein ACFFD2_17220 [Promethearchaeota archaeon]